MIRQWFEQFPSANVAVATGEELAVLDVDPRHGGRDQLWELGCKYGLLSPGPCVESGGGGLHIYFALSAEHRSRVIAPGLELKSAGGSVVAPPSLHISGAQYRWVSPPDSVPLPELPQWLATMSEHRTAASPNGAAQIPAGVRHGTMVGFAGALRRVGGSEQAILAALTADNASRCIPPLPEAELRAIAASVAKYAPGGCSDHSAVSAQTPPYGGASLSGNEPLKFLSGSEFLTVTPEKVDWIAKPWIAAGAVTELTGKVKTSGKTTLANHLMQCVLDGADFLGEPTTRTRIVFLSEQPRVSLRASLERAHLLGREEISTTPG